MAEICPACGATLEPMGLVCDECGGALPWRLPLPAPPVAIPRIEPPPPQPTPPSARLAFAIDAALPLLLGALLFELLWLFPTTSPPERVVVIGILVGAIVLRLAVTRRLVAALVVAGTSGLLLVTKVYVFATATRSEAASAHQVCGCGLLVIAFIVWGKHGRRIDAAELRATPRSSLAFVSGFGLALVAHILGT